ncbi:MAG TPA: CBS domain-containing protein, partial [Vicinamibacterales bacterium]|nr:CBS domain-containing protein [Vicinamibacterales bacterium]
VRTVTPTALAADAWPVMRNDGIHHLVVMNNAELVGVLSDRDAGGRNGAAVRANARVNELMTSAVVSVRPDETIRKVANLMRGRTIGCVPVIDRGHVRGIVTVSDLLSVLGGATDRPARPERRHLHYRAPHRKQRQRANRAW